MIKFLQRKWLTISGAALRSTQRDRRFNFESFTVTEIMDIIQNGKLIKKMVQVALTKTVHDKVNHEKEGAILREMLKTLEDMVDGFAHIKSTKDADDKRRRELGLERYKGHR